VHALELARLGVVLWADAAQPAPYARIARQIVARRQRMSDQESDVLALVVRVPEPHEQGVRQIGGSRGLDVKIAQQRCEA
jgi:hypothetical protein